MRDLASAMSSSSELCFRRALTDIPTRVDCKASGQSQRWQGSVPEADPHQGLLAPTVNSWGMGRDRKPRAPTYHLPDHQRESEILSLEQLFVPIKPHGSFILGALLDAFGIAVSGTILDQGRKSLPGASAM